MDIIDVSSGETDVKQKLKKIVQFIANPRLLLCFGLAWMITNGWSYIMLAVGTWLGIGWMIAVAGAYMAFLWLPISPEKLVTFAIAILLLRRLFPQDEKTLGTLKNAHAKLKAALKQKKQERAEAKQGKN